MLIRTIGAAAIIAATTMIGFTVNAQTKWQMPTAFAPGNFQTVIDTEFAEEIKKETNGELEIIVHSGASLLPLPQIKRAVQVGDVQIGELLLPTLENEDPIFGLDSIPFLVTGYDSAKELLEASRPVLEDRFKRQGMRMLYSVPWPPQSLFTPRPINKIEDLQGLKFRSYGPSAARFGELVGASVATIQVAELTEALRTGLVDSMITSSVTAADSKIWESPVKYHYKLEAWVPRNVVVVNEKAFQKLDKETQETVLRAARTAEKNGWEASRKANRDKLAELEQNGMHMETPSPELAEGLRRVGKEIAAEWEKKAGPIGAELLSPFKQSNTHK